MPTYAQVSDITPRVGGRQITSSTVPSVNDVTAWLNQAEAQLGNLLQAFGISFSYSPGSTGFLTLTDWIATYVAGKLRRAWAAMSGDGRNPDGLAELEAWDELIKSVKHQPQLIGALLSGGSDAAATLLSSHVTDNVAELSADPAGGLPTRGPYGPIWRLDRKTPDSQL